MIEHIFDSNKVKILKSAFQEIGTIGNENARKEIIINLIDKNDVKQVLKYFWNLSLNEFSNNIKPSLFISGAWMFKIKILSTVNWEIRFHLFPKESFTWILNEIWWDCHVHYFQAYSKVLMGKIIEEWYLISKLSDQEEKQYKIFLTWMEKQTNIVQSDIIKALESKLVHGMLENQYLSEFCNKNNIDTTLIAQIHTVYDWSKFFNNNNEFIETFEPIWAYKFCFTDIREIIAWEDYFLPADRGHRVLTENDSATIFITDTTFISQKFKKKNDLFLRWHWQRLPWLQEKSKVRSINSQKISNAELHNILIDTSRKILNSYT